MAEHDSDPRAWLGSDPLAREIVRAAEVDTPPAGFEARLLDRLRSEGATVDGSLHLLGDVEGEAVAAVEESAIDPRAGGTGAMRETFGLVSRLSAMQRGGRLAAYAAVSALAAAAVVAVGIRLSGPKDRGRNATPSPTASPIFDSVTGPSAPVIRQCAPILASG